MCFFCFVWFTFVCIFARVLRILWRKKKSAQLIGNLKCCNFQGRNFFFNIFTWDENCHRNDGWSGMLQINCKVEKIVLCVMYVGTQLLAAKSTAKWCTQKYWCTIFLVNDFIFLFSSFQIVKDLTCLFININHHNYSLLNFSLLSFFYYFPQLDGKFVQFIACMRKISHRLKAVVRCLVCVCVFV